MLAAASRCSMVFGLGALIHSPHTRTIGQTKVPHIVTRNTERLWIALCESSVDSRSAFVGTKNCLARCVSRPGRLTGRCYGRISLQPCRLKPSPEGIRLRIFVQQKYRIIQKSSPWQRDLL